MSQWKNNGVRDDKLIKMISTCKIFGKFLILILAEVHVPLNLIKCFQSGPFIYQFYNSAYLVYERKLIYLFFHTGRGID